MNNTVHNVPGAWASNIATNFYWIKNNYRYSFITSDKYLTFQVCRLLLLLHQTLYPHRDFVFWFTIRYPSLGLIQWDTHVNLLCPSLRWHGPVVVVVVDPRMIFKSGGWGPGDLVSVIPLPCCQTPKIVERSTNHTCPFKLFENIMCTRVDIHQIL